MTDTIRTPEQIVAELTAKVADLEQHNQALTRDCNTAINNYSRVLRQRAELCDRVADHQYVVTAALDKRETIIAWQTDDTPTSRNAVTEASNRLDRALVEHARKYPRDTA